MKHLKQISRELKKRLPRKEKKRRKSVMRKLITEYGDAYAKYYFAPELIDDWTWSKNKPLSYIVKPF